MNKLNTILINSIITMCSVKHSISRQIYNSNNAGTKSKILVNSGSNLGSTIGMDRLSVK